MKFQTRYYALLRDVLGVDSDEFTADSCHESAMKVLEKVAKKRPEISRFISSGYVLLVHKGSLIKDLDRDLDLCSDPVVDLIPPSAGGGKPYNVRTLLEGSVDPESFLRDLLSRLNPEVGAVAVFFGVVKGKVGSSSVEELKYVYHRDYTEKFLEKIVEEATQAEDIKYVAVQHSIGTFRPGATVFAVGVLSRGRKSAIETLQKLIEKVKHEAAIWKVEKREDGTFWVVGNGERIPSRTHTT